MLSKFLTISYKTPLIFSQPLLPRDKTKVLWQRPWALLPGVLQKPSAWHDFLMCFFLTLANSYTLCLNLEISHLPWASKTEFQAPTSAEVSTLGYGSLLPQYPSLAITTSHSRSTALSAHIRPSIHTWILAPSTTCILVPFFFWEKEYWAEGSSWLTSKVNFKQV